MYYNSNGLYASRIFNPPEALSNGLCHNDWPNGHPRAITGNRLRKVTSVSQELFAPAGRWSYKHCPTTYYST
jgi:hypothetical protein